MESILISISMILKILWTVFCKIIIWNKNIKLLIFFTTYSTVEFYFWKRKNEGKEDSWQISARAIWKKMVRCLKRRRKINGYIRCPSVTANFFYFLNKSTELDHPPRFVLLTLHRARLIWRGHKEHTSKRFFYWAKKLNWGRWNSPASPRSLSPAINFIKLEKGVHALLFDKVFIRINRDENFLFPPFSFFLFFL